MRDSFAQMLFIGPSNEMENNLDFVPQFSILDGINYVESLQWGPGSTELSGDNDCVSLANLFLLEIIQHRLFCDKILLHQHGNEVRSKVSKIIFWDPVGCWSVIATLAKDFEVIKPHLLENTLRVI